MVWLLWITGILVVAIGVFLGWITWTYARLRRRMPQPVWRETPHVPDVTDWSPDEVTITWAGHSTVYMNLRGVRILTDPVFSSRVGISIFRLFQIGPRRHTAPALTPAQLRGNVDVIALSHAHLDHTDLPSLRALASTRISVVTARGTSRLLRRLTFSSLQELGDEMSLTVANATVRAVPVRHWGARFPWNKAYSWTGYLFDCCGVRVLYAGDTAYQTSFAKLRDDGPIDIAIIPIGAYTPDSFQGSHCTPEQAWQMFLDSGARWLVPVHWDTFVLSFEPVAEPMQRLLSVAGVQADRIVIRRHGDVFTLPPTSSERGGTR